MTRCLIGMALVSGAAFLAATGEALTVVRCGCRLEFALDGDGRPTYAIRYGDRDVVRPSTLGFETDAGDLTRGFRIVGSATAARHEVWRPVWGEEEEIADDHDELLVELEQAETGRRLNVRFCVFADGVGFRYEFPEQGNRLAYFKIKEERTRFNLPGDPTAWWIPADYDTQEYRFFTSRCSEIPRLYATADRSNVSFSRPAEPGVQTALMLKLENGLYVNLHEAACVDYATMHLTCVAGGFESHLTPDASGCKGRMQVPRATPWRTVIVGPTGADILRARLTLNLNEPCAFPETSWICPVKYVGVWWEMITGRSAWSYTDDFPTVRLGTTDYAHARPHGRHGATTAHVKDYLDFAAANGFDAVLVEGWNVGWEDWFGHMKEDVFDFTTPTPDFNLAFLRDYAASNGVALIMHHETSASTRNYERRLDDAYRFMRDNGYRAVKSGYVGNILPAGDHHYSQPMNNHYLHCIKKAAEYGIMVNAHEAVRPTGLCRTYPNMIGNESARGTEYEAFDGNNPDHRTILPFTRLIGGPMDYTPGIFETDLRKTARNPSQHPHVSSTLCAQLALYVTMYSPLQMAADLKENYERFPEPFAFIKAVPCDWSRSVYLEAEPGDYLTIARKAKGADAWFVGSVADENGHLSDLALDFLDAGVAYEATIYRDADDAHFAANPQAFVIERRRVTAADRLQLRSAPGGGWAVILRPFYKSAATIKLGKPPEDQSRAFVAERFASCGIGVDAAEISRIVETAANIPYYLQELSSQVFDGVASVGRDWVEPADVDRAIGELLAENADWYFEQLKGLPPSQRALARALASEPVREFPADCRLRHSLGVSSTVHTALARLIDAGIAESGESGYHIGDPFFARALLMPPGEVDVSTMQSA